MLHGQLYLILSAGSDEIIEVGVLDGGWSFLQLLDSFGIADDQRRTELPISNSHFVDLS
jgi:hypothetical protein